MINKINFMIAISTIFALSACGKSESQGAETMSTTNQNKTPTDFYWRTITRLDGNVIFQHGNGEPGDYVGWFGESKKESCSIGPNHIVKNVVKSNKPTNEFVIIGYIEKYMSKSRREHLKKTGERPMTSPGGTECPISGVVRDIKVK
jgi:hypothetical protein